MNSTDEPPEPPARQVWSPSRRARVALHVAWILLLALGTVARIGRFGFHPTDQGFMLAQSWRVLHGEIPHTDIISARPLASAILHTVDFALPGPLFAGSGLLSMVEIILATMAVAVLVTRRPVLTWGPLLTALVAASALLSLNSFPLMAWHTIDGIALVACGAWALDAGLRSGKAFPRRAGLFMFGVAVFAKQSFAPVVAFGVLWLLLHPATRAGALRTVRWWRRTVVDLLWLGAFPLTYVAVVTLDGGFAAMADQLTGGIPADGERLALLWLDDPSALTREPAANIGLFAVVAAALILVRLLRDRLGRIAIAADVLLVLIGTVVVIGTVVDGEAFAPSRWADVLWWLTLPAILVNWVTVRRVVLPVLFVPALGFMVSLSWGQDTPTLAAGSLALATVVLIAQRGARPVPSPRRRREWLVASTAVGLAVLLGTGLFVTRHHDNNPYLDVSQDRLTEDLGTVTPSLRWIRTNPSTAKYIGQLGDCIERFPAARVAALPDNPFAYPAFGVRNPFPLEWPLLYELVGDSRQRMLDTADRLSREGGYLVLFETVNPDVLSAGGPVPDEVAPGTPAYDRTGLSAELDARLTGTPVTCGSFVGKWAP
ncbi:hypothetical protein CFN78_09775 [Amycolatopsis antarctica]|uniref:Glycosyltransferase RgtA/B/C/D-like domain-containing protein n=1 Tax=Amycolatopsis antarctica TaxID=1854586 RepID=A0A263D4K9_9PSEU|nr:hypothetical protein CFN78_09775 [Amycolatopsis antarctica]